jgi:predicted metal-dependent phosphoesterase TrpH
LNQTLLILQEARKNRNPGILRRLNRLGFDITLAEVVRAAGDGQIGRPHIARVMAKKGFVQSVAEAFDCFLGHGKPAYVDKYRISCQQAIDIIRGAGGIPVLAHPFLLHVRNKNDLEDLFVLLKKMGLKGIEVYYPEHPPAETKYYAHLAQKHELLMTGGTDFHGNLIPEVKIGTGRGNFFVPYQLYEQLVASLV